MSRRARAGLVGVAAVVVLAWGPATVYITSGEHQRDIPVTVTP